MQTAEDHFHRDVDIFANLGLLDSAPLLLPARHALNSVLMLGNVGAMGTYMMSNDATLGMSMLGATTTLSSIMGVTLTVAIGGQSVSSSLLVYNL